MSSVHDEILEVIERHNREVQMAREMFMNESPPEQQSTPIGEMKRKLERAEYWWAVWFLVSRLYREHHASATANEFVEKSARIQKDYEDMGKSRQWEEAWAIWRERWEDEVDDTGRTPDEDESSE